MSDTFAALGQIPAGPVTLMSGNYYQNRLGRVFKNAENYMEVETRNTGIGFREKSLEAESL